MGDADSWTECDRVAEHLTRLCAPDQSVARSVQVQPSVLFEEVASGKWRRSKMDSASRADIESKISKAISCSQPLEFSVPFGGYKSWHESGAPGINWAEVFWVSYLSQQGHRIAQSHVPGVIFSFSFAGGVMDVVSNFLSTWQEQYLTEFARILDHFSTDRVRFRLVDIADFYGGPKGLRLALQARTEEYLLSWPLRETEKAKKLLSARRNLCLRGLEDLTTLSSEKMEQRIQHSALMCDALDSLEERRHFNKFSTRIQLVFVRGPVPALHVGSCRTSSFHPWVGTGVLEFVSSDTIRERIRSGATISEAHRGHRVSVTCQLPWIIEELKAIFVEDLCGVSFGTSEPIR